MGTDPYRELVYARNAVTLKLPRKCAKTGVFERNFLQPSTQLTVHRPRSARMLNPDEKMI